MPDPSCYSPLGLAISLLGSASPGCAEGMASLVQPAEFSSRYFLFFFTTVALEFPIYFLFLRSIGVKKSLLASLVLNLLTHPAVFFLIPHVIRSFDGNYRDYLLTAELLAPTVEGFALLRVTSAPRAFTAAITANLLSWWLGVYLPFWSS